jgi:hypothetical protein
MKLFVKRIILLPLWIFLTIVLIPFDFIGLFFDKTPIGMEILDWYWED